MKFGKINIDSSSPIFLPDIGTFFNKNLNTAFDLISKLKKSKVKIIKGEILHNADICLRNSSLVNFFDKNKKKKEKIIVH